MGAPGALVDKPPVASGKLADCVDFAFVER